MSDPFRDIVIGKFDSYKKRAHVKGLKVSITFEDFYELVVKDCYYCGIPSTSGVKHESYDGKHVFRLHGLDRVNNNGGYVKTNVVPCCYFCNNSKSNHEVGAWLRWCARVAAKTQDSSKITPHVEGEEQLLVDRLKARENQGRSLQRFAVANARAAGRS